MLFNLSHKLFFRLCQAMEPLTGRQVNHPNLVNATKQEVVR